jgi:hypothetical protein
MSAPLLLAPLLSAVGGWILRHLVVVILILVGSLLLDPTIAFQVGKTFLQTIKIAIDSLNGGLATLTQLLQTHWVGAAQFLALANSLFPLDFALMLVGILAALWLALLTVKFTILLFKLK